MDITQIILALIGSTSLGSITTALVYRRQTRKLKDNEVKLSNVDTQHRQLDLAEDYTAKVMKLSELIYQTTLSNSKDNANIIAKVDRIYQEQCNIVAYLNGDYQDFLQKKGVAR